MCVYCIGSAHRHHVLAVVMLLKDFMQTQRKLTVLGWSQLTGFVVIMVTEYQAERHTSRHSWLAEGCRAGAAGSKPWPAEARLAELGGLPSGS